MNDHVESQLSRLPEPVPPATLARTIMARVARVAEERAPGAAKASTPREEPVARPNDTLAYVAAVGGVAVACGSWIAGALQARWWLEFASSQIGLSEPIATPPGGIAVMGLSLGVLLYVGGLFAPLRNRP